MQTYRFRGAITSRGVVAFDVSVEALSPTSKEPIRRVARAATYSEALRERGLLIIELLTDLRKIDGEAR